MNKEDLKTKFIILTKQLDERLFELELLNKEISKIKQERIKIDKQLMRL